VFVSATNDPTSNQEPFYVSISRQTHALKIWVQDYGGLKRRVAESSVQLNPIELLFGDDDGSHTASGNQSKARPTAKPESGITDPESRATEPDAGGEIDDEQHLERHPDHRPGRDGGLSNPVRRATGEPEALRDSGRDSGINRNPEGVQGQTDELGTDAWRDVLSSELRSGRDQNFHSEAAQQRLDESASDLRSRIARVITSLALIDDDDLVHDSGIVESTREVVEALEPIVSGLEGQPVPTPPKRDLSSAMARVINGLTATDSEKVFSDSGIIEEIKSLVSRVEAHAIAQEQLVNPGEHHVRQNSSNKSPRVTARRGSGYEPDRAESGDATIRDDSRPVAGQSVFLSRNDGENGQVARSNGSGLERIDEASQRQERDLLVARTDRAKDGGEYRDSEAAKREARLPDFTIRATGGLEAIADEIVRIRLQRELAAPLARLASKLEELKELKRLNAEKQARNVAGFQQFLAQAKVEVLDTTLEEWRSLRQEPDLLQIPELAIAPSEVAELTSLIENYPAQKAIEYAMAEFYQAREQALETKSTLKTETLGFRVDKGAIGETDCQLPASPDRVPKPRTNSLPKTKQSTASPGRTAPPAKPQKQTRRSPVRKPVKPEPITAFWQPDYSDVVRPNHIDEKHWNEWVGSRVHPEVIQRRLQSIEGQQVIENLLAKKLEFLGSFEKVGQGWQRRKVGSQIVTSKMRYEIDQYQSLAEGGGWWVDSGADPRYFPDLRPGQMPQRSTYGTFKPDTPREDRQKTQEKQARDPNAPTQYRKYENPAGTKQELFERDLSFADVPDSISDKIFEKYGVVRTDEERRLGVWYTVWRHPEIPIYRVEGDKKDAALTSQGRFVISGQGINAGYRAKDQHDVKLPERVLHPQLELFAVPGREIRYAFDADENRNAILNVRRDMVREAELVEARGSSAYNIAWKPEQGKGIDDLISISGPLVFEKADLNAQPIESVARIHYRTEYNKLARQVRRANPNISAEHLDIEVYLRAIAKGELKDGDRFLSQSDHARSLKDPDQVQAYIDRIKAIAPQYLQQQREYAAAQAAAKAQQVQDRAQYEALSQRVGNTPIEQSAQVIDMQVYLLAESEGNPGDGDRIIAQSDHARLLANPQEVQAYVEHIKIEAPLYRQKQIETASDQAAQVAPAQADAEKQAIDQAAEPVQRDGDRSLYLATANEVAQTLGDMSTEQLDVATYQKISEMDHDPNRVLAQSDHALTLGNPNDVKAYVERLKDLGLEQAKFQAEEQHKLNIRAMGSGSHLLSFLAQKDSTGWRRMTIAEYTFSGTEGYFSVDHRDRGNILKVENEQLTANVTVEDVKKFEKAIANIRDTHKKLNRNRVNRSSGLSIGD
jgi:hypothetical protein